MPPEDTASDVYADNVFCEVLRLPSIEREAAIEKRCQGHPGIATEVRAMLRADATVEPVPTRQAVSLPELESGDRRYQRSSLLGTGSSASVWLAFDRHLQAWTALKIFRPELGERTDALNRVMNEARAASGIISEHVVRITAAGQLEDGSHFIDMQLCAEYAQDKFGDETLLVGQTLADVPPESAREAARMVMEAALGTEAAHRIGVFHRDIKPGNILLTPVSRRALVTDFGLSSPQLHPSPAPTAAPTDTVALRFDDEAETIAGTPPFMAPEQAFGHAPTRGADVYSLGATLYSLLAGHPPYQPGGQHSPIGAIDVLAQLRDHPPTPLSPRAADARLRRIVARAMRRAPSQRYESAAALAEDLRLYLAFQPSSQDTSRPWLHTGLWLRRNRGLATAGGTLLLMLGLFAGSVGWLNMKKTRIQEELTAAEEGRDEAMERWKQADAARAQSDQRAREAAAERHIADSARADAEQASTLSSERVRSERRARSSAEVSRNLAIEAEVDAEVRRLVEEMDHTETRRALEESRDALAQERVRADQLRAIAELEAEKAKKLARERDEARLAAEAE